MLKPTLLSFALAIALGGTAHAFDNDPAHFRADPLQWARRFILPGCLKNAPVPDERAFDACECQAREISERITEQDVANVNDAPENIILYRFKRGAPPSKSGAKPR
jgi:hypothetical protein